MTRKYTRADADARIRDARAALAKYDTDRAKLAAEHDRAQKKIDANRIPAVFKDGRGSISLTSMAQVKVGYLSIPREERNLKRFIELVEGGGAKLEVDGSVARAAKTVAKGLRQMSRADAATLKRLDRQLATLRKKRDELIAASWERGIERTEAEVIAHAAAMRLYYDAIPTMYNDDWRRQKLETAVREAEMHRDYVTGKLPTAEDPADCPCQQCGNDRRDDLAAAKEAERIAALPKMTVECRGCGGKHRAPIDRTRGESTVKMPDGTSKTLDANAPFFRCPKAKPGDPVYVVMALYDKEKAARDKAAAKELRDHGISWLCPHCQETQTTLMETTYYMGDPTYAYVTCAVDEEAIPLAELIVDKAAMSARDRKRAEAFIQAARGQAA